MNLVGICALLSPDVKIFTFELMSNHVHFTVTGNRNDVESFCNRFKRYLGKWLSHTDKTVNLENWNISMRHIETLRDARNVLAYNNRNGFLVNPEDTPFSYLWGANRYFFNREAKLRYAENTGKRKMTKREKRELIHSHDADSIEGPVLMDGYACPLSFCAVNDAENLFRNASQYLSTITKNVESQKEIAAQIGEKIFYNDNELYSIVIRMSKEQYGEPRPTLLPKDGKINIAKELHFDYNASNKQISRMLNLDIGFVSNLFPPSA